MTEDGGDGSGNQGGEGGARGTDGGGDGAVGAGGDDLVPLVRYLLSDDFRRTYLLFLIGSVALLVLVSIAGRRPVTELLVVGYFVALAGFVVRQS